jgi:hypothetical protein
VAVRKVVLVSQLAWFCRAPERSGRLAMSTGAQENRVR